MKRLALALPVAMGIVCGTYTILYLSRWEWNRAIIAGLFFVAIELVVVATLLLERLLRVESRLDALATPTAAVEPELGPTLDAIRATAPPPTDHFRWLRDQAGRTNVFLPVLLGAGVLASALAWTVEHVARATLTPVRERRLAEGLGVLRPPVHGFLGPSPVPATPTPVLRRLALATIALAVVGAAAIGTIGAVDYAADRLQTRPDTHVAGAETTLELELFGAVAGANPDRVLGHLWATCTGPDVFRLRTLPPPVIEHLPGGVVHLVLAAHVGENSMERLRGCLNDTTLDRVQARVVRAEVTFPS
ncbi:MAG TPA: hypothetical protein VFV42_06000 [Acidimicrobiales bacterium]|nr:hypothetical protein [Acidimicrobiales bacterium]